MPGLFRNDPKTPEGKYPIVLRRDGSPVDTPYFVLLVRDPCFADAMAAYADAAEKLGMDPAYVADIRALVVQSRELHDVVSEPDKPPHRRDDPVTLAWARSIGAPSR